MLWTHHYQLHTGVTRRVGRTPGTQCGSAGARCVSPGARCGSPGHGVALRGHDTVQCACSVEQSEADCGLVRTQRPRRRRGPSVTCWLLSGRGRL